MNNFLASTCIDWYHLPKATPVSHSRQGQMPETIAGIKLWNTQEAAKDLGISAPSLRKYADTGYAPHKRIGDYVYFELPRLREWWIRERVVDYQGLPIPRLWDVPNWVDCQREGANTDIPVVLRGIGPLIRYEIPKVPPVVYFLIRDSEVVYIGKSTNYLNRLTSHPHAKPGDFVLLLPCAENELDQIERAWIRLLSPAKNIQMHKSGSDSEDALTSAMKTLSRRKSP